MEFKRLKANQISVRVNTVKENSGASLVVYVKPDVCMDILDESVGTMNWQKHHNGAMCTLSIWDDDKHIWIEREDAGEGTDAKTIASDSFKRACACFGIGRELKTAPSFMWFKATELKKLDGKKCYDEFIVSDIVYTSTGAIKSIQITDTDSTVSHWFKNSFREEKASDEPITDQAIARMMEMAEEKHITRQMICDRWFVNDLKELTMSDYSKIIPLIVASSGCEDVA